VSTFVSSGKANFRNLISGAESNTLIIGQREPLRLKIELTHSWGRPLVYLLIRKEKLEILSFAERRLYRGTYSPGSLSKFINIHPSFDQLWSILRGYPFLKPGAHLVVSRPDQLIWTDRKGRELGKIGIDLENREIAFLSFTGSDIEVAFSEYTTEKGISYARRVRVDVRGPGKYLVLSHDHMVFNRPIPEAIFTLRMPPGFEIVPLEKTAEHSGTVTRAD
jgi:hypothetical protein